MTTPLPARNILDGTATPNTSAMKTAMGSLRDFLADLLGTTGAVADARAAMGAAASGPNSDIASLDATAGVTVKGLTSSSPAAGYIGEVIESVISSYTNLPASATYGDFTSITVTPGTWAISCTATFSANGATCVTNEVGIGTASGTSTTGLVVGDTAAFCYGPNSNSNNSATVPPKVFHPTVNTTYYMKIYGSYSAATEQAVGRITAIRVA